MVWPAIAGTVHISPNMAKKDQTKINRFKTTSKKIRNFHFRISHQLHIVIWPSLMAKLMLNTSSRSPAKTSLYIYGIPAKKKVKTQVNLYLWSHIKHLVIGPQGFLILIWRSDYSLCILVIE
jgi:hypothetical protein